MSPPRLYFAYGSNLHAADLDRWLSDRDFANPLSRPVAPALLPDHRYCYHFYSDRRGGGALDVVPCLGHAVAGMLFQVDDDGWAALDAKEGAPRMYARRDVLVILDDGGLAEAVTYRVVDARIDPRTHVPPTDEYQRVVLEGLARHRLEGATALEAARHGRMPGPIVTHLFVYGTLMQGEVRARHLDGPGGPTSVVPASTRGSLFERDGQDYPALRIGAADGGSVQGEVLASDDVGALLHRIDPVEGFAGHGASGNLYERTVVSVDVKTEGAAPRRERAWTYVMPGAEDGGTLIPSGNWRQRG